MSSSFSSRKGLENGDRQNIQYPRKKTRDSNVPLKRDPESWKFFQISQLQEFPDHLKVLPSSIIYVRIKLNPCVSLIHSTDTKTRWFKSLMSPYSGITSPFFNLT